MDSSANTLVYHWLQVGLFPYVNIVWDIYERARDSPPQIKLFYNVAIHHLSNQC